MTKSASFNRIIKPASGNVNTFFNSPRDYGPAPVLVGGTGTETPTIPVSTSPRKIPIVPHISSALQRRDSNRLATPGQCNSGSHTVSKPPILVTPSQDLNPGASQQPQKAIRLIPDLSAAAFRQRDTNCLVLWHQLRALNASGSGVLTQEDAEGALRDEFHYSGRTLSRRLGEGEGRYWSRYTAKKDGRHILKIQSLADVLIMLDVTLNEKHFREVPAADFHGLKRCRALVYASIHKPKGMTANPVTRDCLSRRTGLCKKQQRRYETTKGVKVRRTPNYIMNVELDGQVTPDKVMVGGRHGQYAVNKRINSYHSDTQPSSAGMLRKIRQDKGSLVRGEAHDVPRRVFFSSRLAMFKAGKKGKGSEGLYLLRNSLRRIQGRIEWATVTQGAGI